MSKGGSNMDQDQREMYHTPELKKIGDLSEFTQQIGDLSGPVDR